MEVTAGAEDFTAEAEDSAAEAEASAEGEDSVEVEDSTEEAALGLAADALTADFVVAATTEGVGITEAAAVTAGVEDIGAEDTATAGAGDLGLGGPIGVGDGDIPMATTMTRGITGPIHIIRIRTTGLRAIPRTTRILATGTTILHRQIPTRGPSPTRTGL